MSEFNTNAQEWDCSDASVFWGEVAPCDHVVQIYESDECFLSTLEQFVVSGLEAQEGVILVATEAHLQEVDKRLGRRGFDVDKLIASHQYVRRNAEEMLSRFMVHNWPDEHLFNACINEIIAPARKNYNRVRAFGEMVALLWADGKNGATVQLERLWNQLHRHEGFSLFCAYPRTGFTQSPKESMKTICDAHHREIDGAPANSKLVHHRKTR